MKVTFGSWHSRMYALVGDFERTMTVTEYICRVAGTILFAVPICMIAGVWILLMDAWNKGGGYENLVNVSLLFATPLSLGVVWYHLGFWAAVAFLATIFGVLILVLWLLPLKLRWLNEKVEFGFK